MIEEPVPVPGPTDRIFLKQFFERNGVKPFISTLENSSGETIGYKIRAMKYVIIDPEDESRLSHMMIEPRAQRSSKALAYIPSDELANAIVFGLQSLNINDQVYTNDSSVMITREMVAQLKDLVASTKDTSRQQFGFDCVTEFNNAFCEALGVSILPNQPRR